MRPTSVSGVTVLSNLLALPLAGYCVVFGMPREAINMGGVCEVVDLSQVSQQMLAKISAGQAIRI